MDTETTSTIDIEGLQVRDAGRLVRTKRSGGPRTAAGKLLSAKNSLKTGTYSNHPVVPGENLEAYLELESYFIKEYNPQTITEGMMVSDLSKNVWKKLRLDRIETTNFISALGKPITPDEYAVVGFRYPRWVDGYLDEVEHVESYDLAEQKALYKIAQDWLANPPSQKDFDEEWANNPVLREHLHKHAVTFGLWDPRKERIYHYCEVTEYYQKDRLLTRILQAIRAEIGPLVWVLEHKDEILEANQRIRDERLRNAMHRLGLNRQVDDVNRRIFKLRDELCKAQDRRIALARPAAKAAPRRIRSKQNV